MKKKERPLLQYTTIVLLVLTIALMSSCKEDDSCLETTWYQDADNDGLGNPDIAILECEQPIGYVSNDSDTDDTPAPSDKRITTQIDSDFIGETYPLRIFLPGGFETKNLPVLYVLDGKTYFEDIIFWQFEIGMEAIVVAIGEHLANGDYNLRSRDFLPGASHNGVTGGHMNFYKFLTEEVIPHVDATYQNDQDARTLIGHHASGLFTSFSLLNESPENSYFYGFLSINVEIFNPGILEEMAENLEYSQNADNIKLHISQVSSTLKAEWFNDLLLEQAFPWLDIDLYTFDDENTDSFNPAIVEPSVKKGLQFIYE